MEKMKLTVTNLNKNLISIPVTLWASDFFPAYNWHFVVLTDDGEIIFFTRKQENEKAIHTPHNNSLIGIYFRKRLGIPLGEKVTMAHLIKYGRSDIDFYKIDDENYYMDFSV
jgi:hypothetical protein